MPLLRHALAVLLLPFMVVVALPAWWLGGWPGFADAVSRRGALLAALGGAVFAIGFALFAWCVALFGRVGKGTLAPWDATRRLVAVGPYRRVRNPMITGVATMLLGEALMTGARPLWIWLATFVAFNHLYFLASEEPGLRRRFGDEYSRYCAEVPRWLPRLSRRARRAGA